MSRSVLSISWLNGQVTAAHVRGSRVVSSWTCPVPVDSLVEVASVLATALHETGFNGRDTVFVVENRNVLYHLQEAPPGRKSLVKSFIQRRVDQGRFFEDDPAAWGVGQAILVKNTQRFLLTLFPRRWLTTLREACVKEGLRLRGVFAPPSVLAHYLNGLPVENGTPVMVAAELGGTLCLMVARKERESAVWFARSMSLSVIPPSGDESKPSPLLRVVRAAPTVKENDRVELEINRTRLFSQQQFDAAVTQLLVVGNGAQQALGSIRMPEGLSQVPFKPEDEVNFLALHAAQLSPQSGGNLMSQIEGPEHEQRRAAAMAVVCLMVFSAGLAGWTTRVANARDLEVETLTSQAGEVARLNQENISLWETTVRRQQFVSAVGSPTDPPIPALFLRYLSARLPDEFALSRVDLNRSSNRWVVRIEGRAKEAGGQLQLVERLEKELSKSPFQFEVTSSTRLRIFQDPGGEGHEIPTTAAVVATEDDRPFFVEGFIP